jgi:signal transduction histidine kinase
MFVISIFLARWAVKPINSAWEKQKQFVADASHELKTPIAIIEANTDVVLSNPDDLVKEQSKWLEYIKNETQRMTKLVQQLLFIAKFDSGEERLVFENFDISELVSGMCLVFEPLIFEKGKALETGIDPDLKINGDADKIKQLVTILIDNAIKHSDENGKVYVALTEEKQKGKVKLIVANTGEPIPQESQDKIFERFYRVDKSRARATGGSGLGLSIAKTIVENHKGSINVYSRPGELTRFVVII